MSLTTLDGVLIALVFILPGALGLQLRSYLWSAPKGTSTEALVPAVAFSMAALLMLEFFTALLGAIPRFDVVFGDFLLHDLVAAKDPLSTAETAVWLKYLAFASAATVLPSSLRWLRKRPRVLKLKKAAHLSLESVGFEALFEESVVEAARWDEQWEGYADEGLHVMVETDDDRRFQGEVMWRSTAPYPPELVLINVIDVTQSEDVVRVDGLLLVGTDNMRRLWILKAPPAPLPDAANDAAEGPRT